MTYTSESESSEALESRIPIISGLPVNNSDDVKLLPKGDSRKVHVCDVSGCSAAFSRPWRLAAHTAVHSGQKPFPCDYEGCGKAFTYNFHLRRHKSTAHTEKSTQKRIRCSYPGCNKEFTLIQNVRKHYRRTHEKFDKMCKTCGERFFNHVQLKKHNRIHKLGYNLKCHQCNVTFQHNTEYNRHKRGHRVHICPIQGCSEVYHNWSLLRKHLTKHPHGYVCHYCKKGYRSRKYLKVHIEQHFNNSMKRKPYVLKKFNCDVCETQLVGKGSLKRHKKQMHETEKEVKPTMPKKERAARKDKGIPKRALAVILSEVIVPKEVEKKLIESNTHILDLSEL